LQKGGRDLFSIFLRLGHEYRLPVFVARNWFVQYPYLEPSLTQDDAVIDHTVTIDLEIAPEEWSEFYRHAIENLPAGVTQFVIHPGFDGPELQAFSWDRSTWGAAWRQRDFDFFTGVQCRALLAKHNIRLINWREISTRLHGTSLFDRED
jgi:hypothetical protein